MVLSTTEAVMVEVLFVVSPTPLEPAWRKFDQILTEAVALFEVTILTAFEADA